MVSVRLTTGEKIKVPDSWATCSTEVFQRIISQWEPEKPIKERSILKLFNCMTGYDINPQEDDLDLEAAIWECTRFVYTEPMDFTKLPLPKTFIIGDKVINIPSDIGRMRIGQNIHVRQELQSGIDPNSIMSLITAIYLQPAFDNSAFDFHRAKEIEKLILQKPITQIYPIGFFLLRLLRNYGRGFLPSLSRMIRRRIQDVQLLLNWRKVRGLINSVR